MLEMAEPVPKLIQKGDEDAAFERRHPLSSFGEVASGRIDLDCGHEFLEDSRHVARKARDGTFALERMHQRVNAVAVVVQRVVQRRSVEAERNHDAISSRDPTGRVGTRRRDTWLPVVPREGREIRHSLRKNPYVVAYDGT